tara:strand:- start:463 stop:807 length:345 start_codon:yes stop_codon:yes gene_type:complete
MIGATEPNHRLSMPKSIDNEAIDLIAKSSGLKFTPDENAALTSSLGSMIELFINMDNIEVCPTKQSDFNKTTYQCLRENTETCATTPKNLSSTYPYYDQSTGFFTVPKVLKSED